MNRNRNQKSKSRDLAELILGMAFMWFTFLILAYHLYGDDTPRAQLPLMSFNEGQPHLTFNELAWFVDAMTFPALATYPANASPDLNVPVAEGDLFIVPGSATGDWSGYDNYLAQYRNAAWAFIQPATGWRVYYQPTEQNIYYDGSAWLPQSTFSLTGYYAPLPILEIKSTISTPNIMSVSDTTNGNSLLSIYRYGLTSAYLEIGNSLRSNRFNPVAGSWIYGNLAVGAGNYADAETPLVVGGAVTLDATDTPPDPIAGSAVLWVDVAGNLRIKSNVADTIHEGTPFAY